MNIVCWCYTTRKNLQQPECTAPDCNNKNRKQYVGQVLINLKMGTCEVRFLFFWKDLASYLTCTSWLRLHWQKSTLKLPETLTKTYVSCSCFFLCRWTSVEEQHASLQRTQRHHLPWTHLSACGSWLTYTVKYSENNKCLQAFTFLHHKAHFMLSHGAWRQRDREATGTQVQISPARRCKL